MRTTVFLGSFVLALAVAPSVTLASPGPDGVRSPSTLTPTALTDVSSSDPARAALPAESAHGDDALVPLIKQKCKKCKCKTCDRQGYKGKKFKCKKCKCKKCDLGGKHKCKKCKCKKCKFRGDKYKCKKCKCKKC